MHTANMGHNMESVPPPDTGTQPHSPFFNPIIVLFNLSFIVFYYLNSFVLIPRLLSRRYRLWYVLTVLVSMVLIVSLPSILFRFWHPMHHTHHPDDEYRVYNLLIRILFSTLLFAIIFIISTGLRIVREWYQAEQQTKDITHEKAVTELSLLKAQINPHFLFNTLNNIYSLSVKKSDDTPQAVMMLADMMRYVLSDAQSDHVPLDKDLEYLSEYIKLQKLRLTQKVTIDYSVTGTTDRLEIAPLILSPFVENAFKYGISTHEASTISIDIRIDGSTLSARVVNKVLPQLHQVQKATGTGLANVRRRLELLYPGRHTLVIDPDEQGYYKVSLHINLS
jgi:LytS/YehU family sensor histidine kinase